MFDRPNVRNEWPKLPKVDFGEIGRFLIMGGIENCLSKISVKNICGRFRAPSQPTIDLVMEHQFEILPKLLSPLKKPLVMIHGPWSERSQVTPNKYEDITLAQFLSVLILEKNSNYNFQIWSNYPDLRIRTRQSEIILGFKIRRK